MLYLIKYENAHWCGGELAVVVWAEDEYEAEALVSDHMEETQRELFSDEYGESVSEDDEYADERAYSVNSVEPFDESHPEWKFFKDPSQASFYPVIGEL